MAALWKAVAPIKVAEVRNHSVETVKQRSVTLHVKTKCYIYYTSDVRRSITIPGEEWKSGTKAKSEEQRMCTNWPESFMNLHLPRLSACHARLLHHLLRRGVVTLTQPNLNCHCSSPTSLLHLSTSCCWPRQTRVRTTCVHLDQPVHGVNDQGGHGVR